MLTTKTASYPSFAAMRRTFCPMPVKTELQFRFTIEYTDNSGNLRYYEPDFVAVTADGERRIVETKGLEDTNVVNKDRAARLWCENTTRLTGQTWGYSKVLQTAYTQLQPTEFSDLLVLE